MLISKVEQRIDQYLFFLEQNAYKKRSELEFEFFETEQTFRIPPENVQWKKINSPSPWGREWACTWFRSVFNTPKTDRPLFLSVLPNADSLAFIDGKPYGAFNLYHKKIRIEADGKEHILHVEAYAGHSHGGCGPFEGESIVVNIGKVLKSFPNTFEGGFLLERVDSVYSLYYDVRALYETAKIAGENSLRKAVILKDLFHALNKISFNACEAELEEQAALARKALAVLLEQKNGPTTPSIHLTGHAHIDHAWLWHIGETERKTARTFVNMTLFAKEYPEFIFIQSQPCQLETVKKEYPDVFNAVLEAYKNGNWEANGGMWVEADCNIPSGESLIRQFLVGKKVNKELLGYEADTLWLPDVFGYAAALPQILAGCRIKYFVTSKINWNDTTRFPYETFIWRGIDGSGVKTHFISARAQGYNGRVAPENLAEIWNEVQHKEIQSACVKSIGEGDGGGGTLRADLEMARRLGDLEGCPRSSWKTVSAALEEIFSAADELPQWRGELYLELHRGTYTTQARFKRFNRLLEFALRDAEFMCAFAAHENKYAYPYEVLLESWKRVLTHQFHDIIPGSSIGRVYQEAEADSAKNLARLDEITSGVRRKIAGETGGVVLFNSLSWERCGPVFLAADKLKDIRALRGSDGTLYFTEFYADVNGVEKAVLLPRIPPLGLACFEIVKSHSGEAGGLENPFVYDQYSLETPYYKIKFDDGGRIISLVDRASCREMVARGGVFNGFITAEDVPVFWDAWDIDADWTHHITEETRLLSTEIASSGPVSIRIRRRYSIGKASDLTQDTVFYAESRRIDFDTKVLWREKWRLLKVCFDSAVDAKEVRCEVQYGHIWRNTHRNLMQDRAKFEICAHKWISLEEEGCGIALLNDCKYGHDVEGGRMRLSLLRSPVAPDPQADRGEHRFTYALLPFTGSFALSGVIHSAYELNAPAAVEISDSGAVKAGNRSLCSVSAESIIIESVKAPENGDKDALVLRLYESLGGHTETALTFLRPPRDAKETDMLEENPKALTINGSDIKLSFRPFEIKTIMVLF